MSNWLRALRALALIASVFIQTPLNGGYTKAVAAVPPVHTSRDSTLYTWKFPQSGGHGAWRFVAHVLQYDGSSNGVLLARLNLRGVTTFAVQASIQALGAGGPESDPTGFGLIIRQRPAAPNTSIRGGSFFSGFPENNNPELAWKGNTVGGAVFHPHRNWHLYRLEVRSGLYTLLIDGKKVVQYPIHDYSHPMSVGIFSTYYRIHVRGFTVRSLPVTRISIHALPPTEPFALTVSDLPITTFFEPTLRHFYTNEEFAREHAVPVSSLVKAGRLVSYATVFRARSSSILDILSVVTAFSTAADAQSDLVSRLDGIKQRNSQQPNLQVLTGGQIGAKSGGLIFDENIGNERSTTLVLSLARGRYTALQQVRVVSDYSREDCRRAPTTHSPGAR